MPKQKTHKGLKKRVKITASGRIKHRKAGKGHLMSSKNAKRKRHLSASAILACRQRGVSYSRFINGCKKAKIGLNRKMLSEIAIADPEGFEKIVEAAKAAIA